MNAVQSFQSKITKIQMKNFFQKYSLHLALALPIFILLLTLAYSLIPQYIVKPQQDFLYAHNDTNNYVYIPLDLENTYKVEKGKLTQTNPQILKDNYQISDETLKESLARIKFYRYDTEKDQNIEVTFQEAEKLVLNPKSLSSDGYTVNFGNYYNDNFPLFFVYSSNSYNNTYISKGSFIKKIQLIKTAENNYYYDYYNYKFLGWITE